MVVEMIDINAEIISFKSMGNINLGADISAMLPDIYINNIVKESEYFLPDGERRLAYNIDNILTVATLSNYEIISIGCNEIYNGLYKNKLFAGIEMQRVIELTSSQRILNGMLIVDGDYGIAFILPSPYDEIADYIEHIPLDLKLNEIYVSDYSFWIPNK